MACFAKRAGTARCTPTSTPSLGGFFFFVVFVRFVVKGFRFLHGVRNPLAKGNEIKFSWAQRRCTPTQQKPPFRVEIASARCASQRLHWLQLPGLHLKEKCPVRSPLAEGNEIRIIIPRTGDSCFVKVIKTTLQWIFLVPRAQPPRRGQRDSNYFSPNGRLVIC